MDVGRCWGIAENRLVLELVFPASLEAEVRRRWPPVGLEWSETAPGDVEVCFGVGNDNIVEPDHEPLSEAPSPQGWDRLEQELTLFAAKRLASRVAIHAACVEWHGAAILVPGASGSGKSRLCIAAHAAGARVLSDEYALVDPTTGLATGWGRPVRVLHGDGRIERVDIAVPSDPLAIALVARITYDPTKGTAWAPMSTVDATFAIMDHALTARARPDDNLDAALAIARSARGIEGARGEADEAVAALLAEADRAITS